MWNKKNIRKFFHYINLLLIVVAIWYIWRRFVDINSNGIIKQLQQSFTNKKHIYLFISILLLMVLNWSLEALKWKLLLKPISKISFKESIKSVLAGVTLSIFTPNRSGEVVGKIFYLGLEEKLKAAILNFSGSLAQMICTCLIGLWSLYFFSLKQLTIHFYIPPSSTILIVAISCTVVSVLFYFNQNTFLKWLSHKGFAKKYHVAFSENQKIEMRLLIEIMLLSFTRYCVFTLQLILLIWLGDVFFSFKFALVLCSIYFFTVWFIPTYALLELGLRGSVAILLFGNFSTNQSGILMASILLWIINIAIPALIGCLFVYQMPWIKRW